MLMFHSLFLRVTKNNFFTEYLWATASETYDQTENFCKSLDLLLSSVNDLNRFFYVLTGDF